jgi:hypothetical protein
MTKALAEIAKQLGRNLEQLPGWGLLLIIVYFVAYLYKFPSEVSVVGTFSISLDFLVVLFTFLLYQVGDALDKGIYDRVETRFLGNWLEGRRSDARRDLAIHEGVYAVAKSLGIAGDVFGKFRIHGFNEIAKFIRSLSLPLNSSQLESSSFSYSGLSSHLGQRRLIRASGS